MHVPMPGLITRIACALCLLWSSAACAGADLDAQREAFRERYAEAELGIWQLSAKDTKLLADYVLWPDLRAAYLRATLRSADDAAIRDFLQTYGMLKPARELRYQYALHLARNNRQPDFLALYQQYYADLGIARLDCMALATELATTSPEAILPRARPLWLVGKNQVSDCDPVFKSLQKAGLLDETLYAKRYSLAIENRQLPIARYLSRSLSAEHQLDAQRWTEVYGAPARFLDNAKPSLDSPAYRQKLRAAIEQVAYNEPQTAFDFWQSLSTKFKFDADDRAALARHTVLWLARYHQANAYAELTRLADAAVDDEVRHWRIRTALREHQWRNALQHLGELSETDKASEQWQYWLAVTRQQLGDATARSLFVALSGERSYYGFLAADAIGAEYNFSHADLPADEAVLENLAQQTAFVRARELFMTGLEGRGRSEWDAAVRTLNADEQVQAAILAHRWGWHSRAIATAANNGRYDDLGIRYPLPYAETFTEYAGAANIRPSWAYGVARSESLFMRDIRSPAGAIGVMQLMPSTGKTSAREINHPYDGQITLIDPGSNIRLGTWYLGRMQARFFDNPVLATAAYNAGPLRVDAWLPQHSALNASIWIETIPYSETRNYVRKVLTADTIFNWRLNGKIERLSVRMPDVQPVNRGLAAN